jgi:hypothetical protein
VKTWIGVALVCLLLPMQVVATNTQVAMCRRGHLNFYFGPISAEVGDHTITSVWLDGGEKDKKFGLGHVTKASPNGDRMLLVADPNKEKPGPGSVIIYTAGLHQAVLVSDSDPDAETSVAIANCTIKDVPQKAKP